MIRRSVSVRPDSRRIRDKLTSSAPSLARPASEGAHCKLRRAILRLVITLVVVVVVGHDEKRTEIYV